MQIRIEYVDRHRTGTFVDGRPTTRSITVDIERPEPPSVDDVEDALALVPDGSAVYDITVETGGDGL